MYKGINEFKKGYQPSDYVINKYYVVGRNTSIKVYKTFIKITSSVEETEIHTEQPHTSQPCLLEVKLATKNKVK